MSKRGLGKGLNALIRKNETIENDDSSGIRQIEIKNIKRNKNQPRTEFNEEKLRELAISVQEHGIIQPLILRDLGNEAYEIIAGERRWRAAKLAGLKEVPAVIKDVTERELTEIALIENIQREDLNPIEEALAFQQLLNEFGLTQDELSKRVGKSRPYITNSLRLLKLPSEVMQMVQKGLISGGHARSLLTLTNTSEQLAIAKKIIEKSLSVRQVEMLIKNIQNQEKQQSSKNNNETQTNNNKNSAIIMDIQDKIQGCLGTKVRIKHGKKRGLIEIEYYGDDDLQRIIDSLLGDTYE